MEAILATDINFGISKVPYTNAVSLLIAGGHRIFLQQLFQKLCREPE